MNIHAVQTGPLGVNTYIVGLGGSEVFIVDPAGCKFSGDENTIKHFLDSHEYHPVASVFTHGHFDHVSGLPSLVREYPQLKILIHEKDKEFIGKHSEIRQSQILISMNGEQFIPAVSNLPEATDFLQNEHTLLDSMKLSEELKKNLTEENLKCLADWKILHTPGHSEGSVCLYNEKERALISGDTLFHYSYGRTDFTGGSEIEIWKSIKKFKHEIPENVRVYPGHDEYGFLMDDCLSF